MDENRCIICGKILHDPLAIYCPECEYELKRVRLADEETFEDYYERVHEEFPINTHIENVRKLDEWI